MRARPGGSSRKHRSKLDRGLGLSVLTGLALLLVIGVVFSVAYGSQQITRDAASLHNADESLRSATVARAQIALAVYMGSVDANFGTASVEPRRNSEDEARSALLDLSDGILELDEYDALADNDLERLAAEFTDTGFRVLDLLQINAIDDAQTLANNEFDLKFQQLMNEFIVVRDELKAKVLASDALLGRIGNVARFLVAFFIPAAVIIVYRELVTRRQHEIELEQRLEAERQLARAREEFIANASHELRTPLTGIAGMAMLLEEDLTTYGSDLSKELVEVIIGEASDLARMVDDLLTTARLDAGALHFAFEDISVPEEVDETTSSLSRNGVPIVLDVAEGTVRADRTRLRQVVRNLVSNANKYGGPRIRIEGRIAGQTYLLSVIDNGNGLPDNVEEHLFERFVHRGRDSATTESVGLGLSIVHALVLGMGGAIGYERVADETRFTMRLPLSTGNGGPAERRFGEQDNPAAAAWKAASALRGGDA